MHARGGCPGRRPRDQRLLAPGRVRHRRGVDRHPQDHRGPLQAARPAHRRAPRVDEPGVHGDPARGPPSSLPGMGRADAERADPPPQARTCAAATVRRRRSAAAEGARRRRSRRGPGRGSPRLRLRSARPRQRPGTPPRARTGTGPCLGRGCRRTGPSPLRGRVWRGAGGAARSSTGR